MKRVLPLLAGVLTVLIFSAWPFRIANAVCCLGVTLGGGVGVYVRGRQQGGVMESVQGLTTGALGGLCSAVALLLVNLLFLWTWTEPVGPGLYLDPVPTYAYAFGRSIGTGLLDIFGNPVFRPGHVRPGLWGAFVVHLLVNTLFGAFGGVLAASMYRREPPMDERGARD